MLILISGLLLFFAAHSVSIVNESWRNNVAGRIGEKAWMGLYSLISITGFVLIVWGYGLAAVSSGLIGLAYGSAGRFGAGAGDQGAQPASFLLDQVPVAPGLLGIGARADDFDDMTTANTTNNGYVAHQFFNID